MTVADVFMLGVLLLALWFCWVVLHHTSKRSVSSGYRLERPRRPTDWRRVAHWLTVWWTLIQPL